jgi:short-subunit dehydrogenase
VAFSAAGKRVLITGASSGVGAALARRLATDQAVVSLIARRRDRLAEVLADCQKHSPDSTMWVADLAESESIDALAQQGADVLGGIDVLVNNAAVPKRRAVSALTPAEAEAVMRVNFFAPMRLTLAVLPGMLVKLIEPGPVDTEIWDQPDNDEPFYDGPKFSADAVADGIVAAMGSDGFEHYVPDMKAVVDLKNADIDAYIAGAAGMARP